MTEIQLTHRTPVLVPAWALPALKSAMDPYETLRVDIDRSRLPEQVSIETVDAGEGMAIPCVTVTPNDQIRLQVDEEVSVTPYFDTAPDTPRRVQIERPSYIAEGAS